MPRFAANLSLLFAERPMLERVQAAASAGFAGVEVQFPYAYSAQEWRDALTSAQVPLILHNLPAGNWMAGERGIATDPKREAEFQDGVLQALDFAQALGDCFPTRQLNCIVGLTPQDTDPIDVHKTLIRNLRYAAEKLDEAGFKLLIEALNLRDVPNFYLSTTAHAKTLIDEVARPNLAIQFDCYHMQIMQGDLVPTLTHLLQNKPLNSQLSYLGHIQIADTPGRHEPGTGEIAYPFVLKSLDQLGYTGWIGCEYIPARSGPMATELGLIWMDE